MTNQFELAAETRELLGKGATRRLRRLKHEVPGIIYGGDEKPHPIQMARRHVSKALENEAFYSHILTLIVDGKPQRVVLKDVQRHPFERNEKAVMHMDFLRITGKEKITMHVPLHFVGADIAPGVKSNGGIVSHPVIDVEVSCLPDALPEFIEVDLSKLGLDESIHLSHLKLPKGVELVALTHGNDLTVATIHLPRAAIEEKPVEAPATESAPASAPSKEGKKES